MGSLTFILTIYVAFISDNLLEIRTLYYRAIDNEQASALFLQELRRLDVTSKPVVAGYLGIAYMLKAKFAYNPYTKFSNFVEGKNLLNKAIEADKRNVELRFLRFCAQANAPAFLAYRSNLDRDKQIILAAWARLTDTDLKRRIKEYMMISEYCTADEKTIFIHE